MTDRQTEEAAQNRKGKGVRDNWEKNKRERERRQGEVQREVHVIERLDRTGGKGDT